MINILFLTTLLFVVLFVVTIITLFKKLDSINFAITVFKNHVDELHDNIIKYQETDTKKIKNLIGEYMAYHVNNYKNIEVANKSIANSLSEIADSANSNGTKLDNIDFSTKSIINSVNTLLKHRTSVEEKLGNLTDKVIKVKIAQTSLTSSFGSLLSKLDEIVASTEKINNVLIDSIEKEQDAVIYLAEFVKKYEAEFSSKKSKTSKSSSAKNKTKSKLKTAVESDLTPQTATPTE